MRATTLLGGALLFAQTLAACRPSVGEPSRAAALHQARLEADEGAARFLSSESAASGRAEPDASVESRLAPAASRDRAPSAQPLASSACNEQAPQPFLIRSSYAFAPNDSREEAARKRQLHQKAIAYRTRRYGYVEGFGDSKENAHEPDHYARGSTFFGIPVRMNARVLVALSCVETEIASTCSETPYQPHNLDGIRFRNTFHNAEITNHAYGIALDLDWDTNPCCGCVAPLNHSPKCKDPSTTAYERTDIPKCWIDTFEKYGFYWLGNDQLEDTMHFEFLGDPSKIRRTRPEEPR